MAVSRTLRYYKGDDMQGESVESWVVLDNDGTYDYYVVNVCYNGISSSRDSVHDDFYAAVEQAKSLLP